MARRLRVPSVEEDWKSGAGLGFDIQRVKDRTYVGHKGGYPSNTTETMAQPDDKVGVIVLTNSLEPLGGAFPTALPERRAADRGEVVRFREEPGEPMRMITGDSWTERMAGP